MDIQSPSAAPLTFRQAEVLRVIRAHIAATGAPPTRAEIARALGFKSPNAAESHLRALARKRAVALTAGASRGIRVVTAEGMPEDAQAGLPVIGRVAAGSPILAEAHVEGHLAVDPAAFSPRAHYLLTVRGMSMRDAGILEGDLLAVHRTPVAETGQVVVARLDDEVTVKRLERHGHRVVLRPENLAFAPIVVDLRRQELVIEGIGVGVIRKGAL
jgi:repressor LexA